MLTRTENRGLDSARRREENRVPSGIAASPDRQPLVGGKRDGEQGFGRRAFVPDEFEVGDTPHSQPAIVAHGGQPLAVRRIGRGVQRILAARERAGQASRTEILTWSISRGLGERFRRRAMLGNGSE